MVKEVDELEEIKKCIENNRNFLLSGGAGSGKTIRSSCSCAKGNKPDME